MWSFSKEPFYRSMILCDVTALVSVQYNKNNCTRVFQLFDLSGVRLINYLSNTNNTNNSSPYRTRLHIPYTHTHTRSYL